MQIIRSDLIFKGQLQMQKDVYDQPDAKQDCPKNIDDL
tara:strand:+ start:16284 stop:16397 length:114 start_codon:yes stop_codon:yes gene_type:complete